MCRQMAPYQVLWYDARQGSVRNILDSRCLPKRHSHAGRRRRRLEVCLERSACDDVLVMRFSQQPPEWWAIDCVAGGYPAQQVAVALSLAGTILQGSHTSQRH